MIEQLLNQPNIWQGRQYQSPQGIDTGYAELNRILPSHGWPKDGLIEVVSEPGTGELSLLAPSLAQLQKAGTLILLSPPWRPNGPQLIEQGLDLNHLLWIHAKSEQQQWSAEQSLKSPACSALVFWPSQTLSFTAYRRLQILCNELQKPCFIFMRQASSNSPCSVRLAITERTSQHMKLCILKSRGSWEHPNLSLAINPITPFLYPIAQKSCFEQAKHKQSPFKPSQSVQ